MILVLEARKDIQSLYLQALGELMEDCVVAPSIGALQQLLRERPRVDLVIAPLEVEVFGLIDPGASVVVSEVVKKLRPEAAFLPVTHEPSPPGSLAMLSTQDPDFSRQLKVAVKRALTNRLLRAVVARVCHEINNPASAILGNADLVVRKYGDELPEGVKRSLTVIEQQAVRVGNVTRVLNRLNPEDMEIVSFGETAMISFPE